MFFCCLWWLISLWLTIRLYNMGKIACRLLRLHLIYPKLGWSFDLAPYKDSWVVATGVTDGIGKAYLNEIAARGFKKFALVGRNRKKLDGLQRFLGAKHKADVKLLTFDFATTDYAPLEEFIKGLGEIGTLLNFVGTSVDAPKKYAEHPPGLGVKIFATNAVSTVQLTEMILPGMAKADKGLIVHCSSVAGHRPVHNLSTYSASKAAVSFLGESTAMEYNSKTLRIQVLTPAQVSTKLLNFPAPGGSGFSNFFVLSPEDYAQDAVGILGLDSYAMGAVKHEIQALLFAFFPHWLFKYVLNYAMPKQAREWGMYDRKLD